VGSNRKTALVIGAHANDKTDCARWNPYFANRNTTWCGLPARITGVGLDYSLEKLTQPKANITLLRETIRRYQKQCDDYIETNLNDRKFDLIMLDRFTTHALVIQNPIDISDDKGKDYNVRIYDLWRSKFLNNGTSVARFQDGRLNKTILCLLFINLLRVLKFNGSFIVDTAYIEPEHVEILKKFFNAHEAWDFTTAENTVLEYTEGYQSGSYLPPKFIHFKDFHSPVINPDEITKELVESVFPEERQAQLDVPNISQKAKNEYLSQIEIIFNKAVEMTIKAETDDDYVAASQEAQSLHGKLKTTADQFFEGKINFQKFKDDSKDAITTAKLTLDWHRGFFRVMFSNIIAAIGQFFGRQTRYNFTLFQKTDSSKKLDVLKTKLNEIQLDF